MTNDSKNGDFYFQNQFCSILNKKSSVFLVSLSLRFSFVVSFVNYRNCCSKNTANWWFKIKMAFWRIQFEYFMWNPIVIITMNVSTQNNAPTFSEFSFVLAICSTASSNTERITSAGIDTPFNSFVWQITFHAFFCCYSIHRNETHWPKKQWIHNTIPKFLIWCCFNESHKPNQRATWKFNFPNPMKFGILNHVYQKKKKSCWARFASYRISKQAYGWQAVDWVQKVYHFVWNSFE